MKTLIPTPHTKCFVRIKHICQTETPTTLPKLRPAYLIGVCVILNEAPKLMIMTDEGAAFSYVPPHAICFSSGAPEITIAEACAWDCLADSGEIIEIEFLRSFPVEWQNGRGRYLFSLHFDPRQAWGREPEQLKIFHFIEGADGNLFIKVNNQLRWKCGALDQSDTMTVRPLANKKIWFVEN